MKFSCQVEIQHLPAVSFCPGFRQDKVKGNWWLRPNHGWEMQSGVEKGQAEDMEEAWDELNFSLDDVLIAAFYEQGEMEFKVLKKNTIKKNCLLTFKTSRYTSHLYCCPQSLKMLRQIAVCEWRAKGLSLAGALS